MLFRSPGGVYVHICGTDLIRDVDGQFLVLEDNGRTPSGVSYVLENRAVMKKVFPQLFADIRVKRVEDYPRRLREALSSVAPNSASAPPCVVVLQGKRAHLPRKSRRTCSRNASSQPAFSRLFLMPIWAVAFFNMASAILRTTDMFSGACPSRSR